MNRAEARTFVARAAAACALLASIVAIPGLPGGAASRDVYAVVDVSRSHGPDAWQLLIRAAEHPALAEPGIRVAVVLAGRDAVLLRALGPGPPIFTAAPALPAGFRDETHLDRAVELVRAGRDPERTTEILLFTDGRTDERSFARATEAAATAGIGVRKIGPLAEPASDLRLAPLGPAEPVSPGRVRVRVGVRTTGATSTTVAVRAEPPGIGGVARVSAGRDSASQAVFEAELPDGAEVVSVRIVPTDGPDAHAENDVLRVPVLRRIRRALVVDDGSFDGISRPALREATGSFHVERAASLREAAPAAVARADLVVLVDQDASDPALGPFLAELRRSVVDRGAGLVVIGGPRAFRAGGYAASVLEDLSPLSSRADRGRDVRILLDASGSMDRDDRYGRAIEAVRRLALAAGPDDVLRVRPFAATPGPPIPAVPGKGAVLAAAVSSLERTPPKGGTRLLPALDAELEDPASEGRRLVLLVVSDVDDAALDDPDQVAARRTKLDAADAERIFLLLDPRPETEARALAFGAGVLRVGEISPRLLFDALETGSFESVPTPLQHAEGAPPASVPWRNRVRDGKTSRIDLRAADGAPLTGVARRGGGTVVATAAPLDRAAWAAYLESAARPAAVGAARATREADRLVFTLGPEATPPLNGPRLRIGRFDMVAAERSPGVYVVPWRDEFGGEAAALAGSDGSSAGVATVGDEGDHEWSFEPLPPGPSIPSAGPAEVRRSVPLFLALFAWAVFIVFGGPSGLKSRRFAS